jgi:hypothetical protein
VAQIGAERAQRAPIDRGYGASSLLLAPGQFGLGLG